MALTARKLFPVGLFWVSVLSGCPQATAIWVATGSTADSLVLVRGLKRHHEKGFAFSGMEVWSCDKGDYEAGLVWRFELAPESRSAGSALSFPARIVYGEVPRGYKETIAPAPLRPGCYGAWAGGLGQVAFIIDSQGGVTELDSVPRPVGAAVTPS